MKQIFSIDDFLSINKDGEYSLACDIDLKGVAVPFLLNDFHGIFDGNNHSIKNLTLESKAISDGQGIALIRTGSRFRFHNLNIENMRVLIDCGPFRPHISVLFGEIEEATISNVFVSLQNPMFDIPMIYDANNCEITDVRFNNGFSDTICKYK